jgi:hypothetical protein
MRLDAGVVGPDTVASDDELFQAAADAGIEIPDALRAAWPAPLAGLSPDGGYGSLADEGGLGELRAYLSADSTVADSLDGFLWTDGLHAAQRALGLPENPAPVPAPSASPPPAPAASATP